MLKCPKYHIVLSAVQHACVLPILQEGGVSISKYCHLHADTPRASRSAD